MKFLTINVMLTLMGMQATSMENVSSILMEISRLRSCQPTFIESTAEIEGQPKFYSDPLKVLQPLCYVMETLNNGSMPILKPRDTLVVIQNESKIQASKWKLLPVNSIVLMPFKAANKILKVTLCINNTYPELGLELIDANLGYTEPIQRCTLNLNGQTLRVAASGGLPFFK